MVYVAAFIIIVWLLVMAARVVVFRRGREVPEAVTKAFWCGWALVVLFGIYFILFHGHRTGLDGDFDGQVSAVLMFVSVVPPLVGFVVWSGRKLRGE